jgi:hypothetical protein
MRTVAALLFLAFSVVSFGAPPTKIDRTFTSRLDLTGDGSLELVTIRITGDTVKTPYRWTLRIAELDGSPLYQLDRDDTWLDRFFRDAGYVPGCSGYVACKSRYYFHDLPDAVFASGKPSRSAWLTENFKESDLRDVATAYLKKRGASPGMIERAILEMTNTLAKPGFRPLNVPFSPVQGDPPMIWVRSVHEFVPYYQQ